MRKKLLQFYIILFLFLVGTSLYNLSWKTFQSSGLEKMFSVFEIKNSFAQEISPNSGLEIFSPTNPNKDGWSSSQNVTFSWQNSPEIEGISIEFDNNPLTLPDFISEGIFSSKSYSNLESGLWYFHLRIKNEYGWSDVSHFKVQIDREPPRDFVIRIENEGDLTNPRPLLYFETSDDLSGINYYKVRIDGQEISSFLSKGDPFVMPLQRIGIHNVDVVAVDYVGNEKKSSVEINIESIMIPEILSYPKMYNAGKELFYIGGKSSPDAIVSVFLKKDSELIKTWETVSNKEGSWSFYSDELFPSGAYTISAKSEDSRSAQSVLSEEQNLEIFLSGFDFGFLLIDYGSLILILILLIIIFLAVLSFYCRKIKKERVVIRREVLEAEESLKKTFQELRKDLEKKIEYFDSKPGLSIKEKKIRDKVFKILRDSERIMEKELRDIERSI